MKLLHRILPECGGKVTGLQVKRSLEQKPGRVLKMFIKFREISKVSRGEEMGVKTMTEPTITSEYSINSGK